MVTVKEWLEGIAASTTSDEQDGEKMQNLLRRVGFPRAVVVVGIVYVEGRGTIDFPPMPIQGIAEVLLKKNNG